MSTVTTAMCYSFKQELLESGHNFLPAVVPSGATASSGSTSVTAVASMSGICVGMSVTGTNVAANTIVARITSSSALTLSLATTGAVSAGGFTFSGDVFYLALITGAPTNSYSGTMTNYGAGSGSPTTSNLGTDEVANGSGYVTGGTVLTTTAPQLQSTSTATMDFSGTGVSWTSATFNTLGALIYNAGTRLQGTSNRAVGTFSFGGENIITGGTFVLNWPSSGASTSIIRIS